jgi:hypothetical protein
LRQPDILGRSGKVAVFGDFQKVSQLIDFHVAFHQRSSHRTPLALQKQPHGAMRFEYSRNRTTLAAIV